MLGQIALVRLRLDGATADVAALLDQHKIGCRVRVAASGTGVGSQRFAFGVRQIGESERRARRHVLDLFELADLVAASRRSCSSSRRRQRAQSVFASTAKCCCCCCWLLVLVG